jgi:hypothetical protein
VGNYRKYNTNLSWAATINKRFQGTITWEIIEEKTLSTFRFMSIKDGINIHYNGYVMPARFDTTIIKDNREFFDLYIDSQNKINYCDPNCGLCNYGILITFDKYHYIADSVNVESWPTKLTLLPNVGIKNFSIPYLYSNSSPHGEMKLVDYIIK